MRKNNDKLCEPDPQFSIFRLVVYFSYNYKDTGQNAERVFYSRDYLSERHPDPDKEQVKKPLSQYNGYIHLVNFIEKIFNNGQLKKANIYFNRKQGRPLLQSFSPETFTDGTF